MYVFLWPVLQEVVAEGMKALYGLFMQRPSASSLPADVNAQIINVSHSSHAASLVRQTKWFITSAGDFNYLLNPVLCASFMCGWFFLTAVMLKRLTLRKCMCLCLYLSRD